jgi:hypothetical protein
MENFSLKSLFIYDSTLRSKKRKPSDDEMQDIKLLYYYPIDEVAMIKRSNMGILEGTISFMDAFEQSSATEKFILVEMSKFIYIADSFDEDKSIGMILSKNSNAEFSQHQNIEVKKAWFKSFLKNFHDMFVLYQGPIQSLFFKNGENLNDENIDIRNKEMEYKNLCEVITDFIHSYFEILPSSKIPFLDNILYFPLNESSHSQLVLASQRLREKMPDIKYVSLMYKGYVLHNEAPLESLSLIYNSFFNNVDASPRYFNFSRPPYKVVQTVYSGAEEISELVVSSPYRKGFELIGHANYLIGLNRININNYHVFIPTIYFATLKEKVKLLVFFQNGLMLFLFLNENFNPQSKVSSLIKLERWVKRYFDEEIPGLENLYQQKTAKFDTVTFAYVNNTNKSIKLSSTFFSKKNKLIEKEKIEMLFNIFKVNFDVGFSSLMKIKGFFVYYITTCERKVVILLPESLSLFSVKQSIEEIKKDLFDYIFIL